MQTNSRSYGYNKKKSTSAQTIHQNIFIQCLRVHSMKYSFVILWCNSLGTIKVHFTYLHIYFINQNKALDS